MAEHKTTAEKTQIQKSASEKPRLILTHGEKGGVGKTTAARVIADFLDSREAQFRAFDAEGETGQLLRFHSQATTPIDVTKAVSVAPVLDYLMDGGGKRLALVDLGARTGADLKGWLYRAGALEEAEDGGLGITVVYVLGGAVDSVGHLKECYDELGRVVDYVVVKNYGVANSFELYEQSNIREELLNNGAREIAFPALDGAVYQSVDKASISFQDFIDNRGGDFSYTERRYCRTWLRECFLELEQVTTALR
jgi:hypothetical protein